MSKFCTWCGAPLEPGARYCGDCGARILETVTIDGSPESVDGLRGFDIVDGRSLPADATVRMDSIRIENVNTNRDAVVVPTDNQAKKFSLDSQKRRYDLVLKAMIGLIIVLSVIAAIIGVMYFTGWSPKPAEQTPQQNEAPNDGDSNAQAPSDVPAEGTQTTRSVTDDEAFTLISEAYEKLSTYDDRIGGDNGCVDDFNAWFLADSMDKRTEAKETADTLLADLQADLQALQGMILPEGTVYADQVADVVELYECQVGRVTALTEAWALDVTFEKPSSHADEILGVYSEYNQGNKFLTRFDELYPQAKPHEIS